MEVFLCIKQAYYKQIIIHLQICGKDKKAEHTESAYKRSPSDGLIHMSFESDIPSSSILTNNILDGDRLGDIPTTSKMETGRDRSREQRNCSLSGW